MVKERLQYWLMKSEPEVYSIEQFRRDGRTLWTGVRNYQARNFMMPEPVGIPKNRAADAAGSGASALSSPRMRSGDLFLFYHSNAEPTGVAGIGRIVRTGVTDPTQFDRKSDGHDPKATKERPIWFCAECEYIETFPAVFELSALRAEEPLKDLLLLRRGMRLSVQPVLEDHYKHILRLARKKRT